MKEGGIETENKKPEFRFEDLSTAEEYLKWKQEVPSGVRRCVESTMKGGELPSSQTGLILTDQFLDALGESLAKNKLADLSRMDTRMVNLLTPLERVGTKGGYLNVFETLRNPDTSWNLKRKIFETQIKPSLDWLREKDLADLAEKIRREQNENDKNPEEGQNESEDKSESENEGEGESGNQENNQDGVPSPNEKVQPGGDTREKKEGEPAAALFSVSPFFGGYYKQLQFNRFDGNTLEWQKPENEFREAIAEEYESESTRIIFGKIQGGQPLSLPLPAGWMVDPESFIVDAPEGSARVLRNQEGLWYLSVDGTGVFKYQIRAYRKQMLGEEVELKEGQIEGNLPSELKEEIKKLEEKRFSKVKIKRELVKFVRNNLKYVTSDEINSYYTQKPAEVFERMWQRKEANCYWANTLAARALSEIDDQWAFISGFSVREKDEQGNAILHSGNGHSWLEVWDDLSWRAVRLDATPKGDPTVDEEQQEQDFDGDPPAGGEGDYGESDDELASEKEIQEKIKELQKAGAGKQSKKLTLLDMENARFADAAECTPAQAQEFLRALDRAREIKDTRGIPISELLKLEWKKIVIENTSEKNDYRGPVRMDEGDNLEDPVSARIDIVSKEFNPTGFEKLEREEKLETEFGGLSVYFSFDLSGSMKDPDSASGRRKADVQRDAGLLFTDSLMQCAYISRQQGSNSHVPPLKIMVTLASETGETKLPLTDKWESKEQWAFYAALNQLARGGTPTAETLLLIEQAVERENAELDKKKISKDKRPLHYVVVISDGAPNDFDTAEAVCTRLAAKGVVVRICCVGGVSESAFAAEPIESFSQLPEILSQDITGEFKKLHPNRIQI